jgi:ABC-2 type transport system permease protein
VFGLIRAGVLRSTMGDETVNGLTARSATAFIFVSQALISVTTLFGDYALVGLVKSGDVATELHRPWDWSLYRLGADLGKSAFAGITRGLAIAVGGWILFALPAPDLRRTVAFLVTVVLAAVLASRIWTISGVAAFWLVDATGVVQLFVALAMFSTGLVVPLQLLPGSLGSLLGYSPFASLIQRPADVLLGQRGFVGVVAAQFAWIGVAEAALRCELRAATRKLEVQGG